RQNVRNRPTSPSGPIRPARSGVGRESGGRAPQPGRPAGLTDINMSDKSDGSGPGFRRGGPPGKRGSGLDFGPAIHEEGYRALRGKARRLPGSDEEPGGWVGS